MSKHSIYYPNYTLNPIAAQNQPYPSSHYYPYPEPKDTYGINATSLKSLKTLDIEDLQDVFGRNFQEEKSNKIGKKLENDRMINEDIEIGEIKKSIEKAKLNKILAKQIYQNQMRRMQNLINDTKTEEECLKDIQKEDEKKKKDDLKRKQDMLKTKYLIQQQILDKEHSRQESLKEYAKDKKDIDDLINRMKQEDILAQKEKDRKKQIAKAYMENSYALK